MQSALCLRQCLIGDLVGLGNPDCRAGAQFECAVDNDGLAIVEVAVDKPVIAVPGADLDRTELRRAVAIDHPDEIALGPLPDALEIGIGIGQFGLLGKLGPGRPELRLERFRVHLKHDLPFLDQRTLLVLARLEKTLDTRADLAPA